MKDHYTFGPALEALKQGKIVRRGAWNAGSFVFRQVPSAVPAEIVPKMTSLPPSVKDELIFRGASITYQNQLCMVHADNTFHGYQPSVPDLMAEDWEITGGHVVASETAGTAQPLE